MTSKDTEYATWVGADHKNRYAQFFTEPRVANFMVGWVLDSRKSSIYDPAFGLGAFYDALPSKRRIQCSASEIDPKIVAFWRKSHPTSSVLIKEEDYLLEWGRTHENIVCNPPYMRFQKFLARDLVFKAFEAYLGYRLSGYTNTASAFLLKSLAELEQDGRLAYIMPLEFLSTGYGTLTKEKLIASGGLKAVISLQCEKDVFPDVTTSVGIILVDSSRRQTHVAFHVVRDAEMLRSVLDDEPVRRVPIAELSPREKWLPLFQSQTISVNTGIAVPLEHYGRFSRGIATGANEFFVLRPSSVEDHGLEQSEVVRCITRSSQIRKPIFTCEDFLELQNSDVPVFLFRTRGVPSKPANDYIREGERRGFDKRYLTRARNPWYKTECRDPAPLLLGVFSRDGYKIVRNLSDALTLTCYHGFQPNLFGQNYLDHLFLYFLSSTGRRITSLSMRRYGDALDKFEPNDLNASLVPNEDVFNDISNEQLVDAMSHVRLTGDLPHVIDRVFVRLQSPNEAIEPTR